jgi:uncharacterized protein (DUF1501 family)
MEKSNLNLITRRGFLGTTVKSSLAVALSTLVDIPFVMKRALAEGSIGLNGKKILFIWLRGANDGLNSLVPMGDPAYVNLASAPNYPSSIRPSLRIPPDAGHIQANQTYGTPGICFDPTVYADAAGTPRASAQAVYSYGMGIPLGNGFAALHPSLKFLAPVFNAGDLCLVDRVAYPRQSRSHFDSQRYWENGSPNNNLSNDGIFYRTILESGLANTAPLTGVSIQSSLPLILRGSEAAMTNLNDPANYRLYGVPWDPANPAAGGSKATNSLASANASPFPSKMNRELLGLQYDNLSKTLGVFAQMNFTEAGNTFRDDIKTDGDTDWYPQGGSSSDPDGYYLFPTTAVKNGGWRRPDGSNVANKYVVHTNHQSFFANLKAAALVLNKTDALIAGTEFGGFDTHKDQGGVAATASSTHPENNKTIGWAMYALRKYFSRYGDRVNWDNVIVVTLSEFGRTTIENSDLGTDHAEAGLMWVAGGGVNGSVYNCGPGEFSGLNSALNWNPGSSGSMFGVSGRYLSRNTDYRSVLGEIIRKHLGATQGQVNRIIPGYVTEPELVAGGNSSVDGTRIRGEVGLL